MERPWRIGVDFQFVTGIPSEEQVYNILNKTKNNVFNIIRVPLFLIYEEDSLM